MNKISMETTQHFDYLVIGAGSGGVASARRAASHGAKVAIIEKGRVGGTCVIRGCVPKKIMTYLADLKRNQKLMQDYGFEGDMPTLNFAKFVEKRNAEIDRLNGIYLTMLKNSGVALIEGHASFIDAKHVQVTDENGHQHTYRADNILIATGSKPTKPNIPGAEYCLISDDMWGLTEVPTSLTVIGAGFIGIEFACIMRALGAEVNIVYRAEHILRGFDTDMVIHLEEMLISQGIKLYSGTNPNHVSRDGDTVTLTCDNGNNLTTSHILMATGRSPNTEGIGLEHTAITLDKGYIHVNDKRATEEAGIYAVGDVTNNPALTPVAIRDGRALAEHLFNNQEMTTAYSALPVAVFSEPQLATVGLTEEEARTAYNDDVDIKRTTFKPMKYTFTEPKPMITMKLVLQKSTQTVVGCHMVGTDAAEIIQAIGVAIGMKAKMCDFYNTVALHPSSAEELVLM